MARVGVLSDLAVKHRNPEFFPLDVGGQELNASYTFTKKYI
jgi:hypothetical protein